MKLSTLAAAALLLFGISENAAAAEGPKIHGRAFVGFTSAAPSQVNAQARAQGIQEFTNIPKFGLEGTYPIASFFELGVRYTKRYLSKDEAPSTTVTNYDMTLEQDAVQLIARVPFYQSDFFVADIFGAVGGSNTYLKFKTATQTGEVGRHEPGDALWGPINTSYGGSISLGYKSFFLFVEGGFDNNKVESLIRTGTASTAINSIDFSSNYVSVGFLYRGVPTSTKTK